MKNIKLNRYDMKILESYIINIEQLKFRKLIREYELHDKPVEDNPGASRSNIPGDPVYQHVAINLEDDYYNNLDKIIKAVDKLYNNADEDVKYVFNVRYWGNEVGVDTWEGMAEHLYTSKTNLLRVRETYLKQLANDIDYVSSEI